MFARWAALKEPLAGSPRPLGSYSAGCLAGAKRLPESAHYQIMRPSRGRYYGHPELLAFLDRYAKHFRKQELLVGDLGMPRGGPMLSGHASHQIGLDADIWFYRAKRKLSRSQREQFSAPSYVAAERVTKSFQKAQSEMLKWAALDPAVERIFVNPAIKRQLCRDPALANAPWIAKIRAWWGHQEHFHVRLFCPAGAKDCAAQESLAAGDNGCGADLDWWFSAEAKEELAKRQREQAERIFPVLPEACRALAM